MGHGYGRSCCDRLPAANELSRMRDLAATAWSAGAVGLPAGLFHVSRRHVDADGPVATEVARRAGMPVRSAHIKAPGQMHLAEGLLGHGPTNGTCP
jgi:hypothetical protein